MVFNFDGLLGHAAKGETIMAPEYNPSPDLVQFIAAAELHLDYMRQLIEGSGVFVRRCDHRDVVIGAHLSRMTLTSQSVFHLCRLGNSHDAQALCRVILEHNVNFIFLITHEDTVKSSQDFVFDSLTHLGNSHLKAAKHHPEAFPFHPDKAREAIKLGEDARYQNGFIAQLESLMKVIPQAYFDWYKELVYGDLSISTHPHASGLDPFAPAFTELFKLKRPSLPWQDLSTATLAWALTQSAYAWTAVAWGLPWRKDLIDSSIALLTDHPNARSTIGVGMYLPDLPSPKPKRPDTKKKKKLAKQSRKESAD